MKSLTSIAALLVFAAALIACQAKSALEPCPACPTQADSTTNLSGVPDTTAPTVASTGPAAGSTNVAYNSSFTATFSEAMDTATINATTFTLLQGATPISATVGYANLVATLHPTSNLDAYTAYQATVSTGVRDLAGNALATARVWTFTTGAWPDTTAPTVLSVTPVDASIDVSTNTVVTATFSEAMDPATLTLSTVTLKRGATPVACAIGLSGNTVTLTPTAGLLANAAHTATVSTAVKDLAGNPLAADKVWSFTTAVAPLGPPAVNLKSASNFTVLASTSMTVGAGTVIDGNVGLTGIGSSGFVGFAMAMDGSGVFSTSSLITGKGYAIDYSAPTPATMAAAQSDAQAAYTDALGRTGATDLGIGELGGRTLAPGLYAWGAAVTLTTDATLSGGSNDVWIFQVNGALSVAAAITLHLAGGAKAKNVYWQAVGAVSMGAGAIFEGIVLSQAAVSLGAGAIATSRFFAQTTDTVGAGSLVTQPAP